MRGAARRSNQSATEVMGTYASNVKHAQAATDHIKTEPGTNGRGSLLKFASLYTHATNFPSILGQPPRHNLPC